MKKSSPTELKIVLSPEQKSSLTEARAWIAEGLKEVSKTAADLESANKKMAEIQDELERLQNADVNDIEAMTRVSTLETQLGFLRKRIEPLEAAAEPSLEMFRHRLLQVHEDIAQATEPSVKKLEQDICAVISPFFGSLERAVYQARQTDVYQFYWNIFLRRRYGNSTFGAVNEAREVLRIMDALLKGESPFSFEPAE